MNVHKIANLNHQCSHCHHDMSVNHCQSVGGGPAERLPIGYGGKPYFASGSCSGLERAIQICADFDKDHPAPHNEEELIVYCRALRPVLATLHKVGSGYVGTVLNLSRPAQMSLHTACSMQHCQCLCKSSCACLPGPHILRKILLAHSCNLKCQWRVPIKVIADICGPDMQGALEQLKHINPYFYKTSKAQKLGVRLGIQPPLIALMCCIVRPLALWEDHARFPELVGTAAGHQILNGVACAYRADHQYCPSPALVFEQLLGSPTAAARARERQRKLAVATADAASLNSIWLRRVRRRRAASLPAPLPAAAAPLLAGLPSRAAPLVPL